MDLVLIELANERIRMLTNIQRATSRKLGQHHPATRDIVKRKQTIKSTLDRYVIMEKNANSGSYNTEQVEQFSVFANEAKALLHELIK